ncbi:JEMB protein [Lutibacter profundi]|uniref:JEMB protein n=1 Tax=Lutibacter profundi TaxID=1622118 RepID=A0A109RMU9_9FLAO|nr:antibiotic biosynthesis monooxygenase [Lutibacter profundi]AMC09832.1 JEMB protein [Lutibacter profundi]
MIANTPKPPYYAVIFSSIRAKEDVSYSEISDKMIELAQQQEGFLGMESAKNEIGITVSYWDSLEAIKNWKMNVDHAEAREKGRSIWYEKFKVRISKVERDYGFDSFSLKK